MKLKMLATVRPQVYQSQKEKMKIVRMRKLQDMPRLLGMVSLWQHDRVYDVHIRDVHLAVKIRKLLGENHVPVNLFRVSFPICFKFLGQFYNSLTFILSLSVTSSSVL